MLFNGSSCLAYSICLLPCLIQYNSIYKLLCETTSCCRLGEDKGYKQYKNYFVENTLALNKYQHKEEKDKERHVGYKFSLSGPVEFQWSGSVCGSRVSETNIGFYIHALTFMMQNVIVIWKCQKCSKSHSFLLS